MNLCFKDFLERVAPTLVDSGVCLDWTSVFIRQDSSEHIIRVDAQVEVGRLEFPDKNDYSENLIFAVMNPGYEMVTSAFARKSVIHPPRIVVNTVIDVRINR